MSTPNHDSPMSQKTGREADGGLSSRAAVVGDDAARRL